MTRALTGLAAWLAGTALAVGLAWFGANMVVRDAGMSPGVQVIDVPPATPPAGRPAPPIPPTAPTAPARPTASASRASGRPARTEPGRTAAAGSPSPSPSASPSPSPSATPSTSPDAGTVRSYTLAGGRVALQVTGDSATLVTATPDSGFAVQTWSGTDWLRVDFSSGAQVSSLIASWYQHAPTVTIEN